MEPVGRSCGEPQGAKSLATIASVSFCLKISDVGNRLDQETWRTCSSSHLIHDQLDVAGSP